MPRILAVDIQTVSSAIVKVEISDKQLADLAESLDVSIDELTVSDLEDLIYENLEKPTICAMCTGYGNENVSLDLGDEWEISEDYGETRPEFRSIRDWK